MSRLILVLGCHRSGPSLVARSMKCLGAELGPRAEWTADDNPRGFHEHQDVLEMNTLILNELGIAWDDPQPIKQALIAFIAKGRAEAFRRAIRLGLGAELARYPLLAIKEPRRGRE